MHIKARLSVQQAIEDKDLQSRTKKRQSSRNVNSGMISLVQISTDTDQLRILRRIDQQRANQRANPKTYGQAITPETVRTIPILQERISNEDFETTSKIAPRYYGRQLLTGSGGNGTLGKSLNNDNRMDEDDPRDQYRR
jgi:hypothetical protein